MCSAEFFTAQEWWRRPGMQESAASAHSGSQQTPQPHSMQPKSHKIALHAPAATHSYSAAPHRFSALAGEEPVVHRALVLLGGPPHHRVLKPQPVPRAAAAGKRAGCSCKVEPSLMHCGAVSRHAHLASSSGTRASAKLAPSAPRVGKRLAPSYPAHVSVFSTSMPSMFSITWCMPSPRK